jgi:hypothetical protein
MSELTRSDLTLAALNRIVDAGNGAAQFEDMRRRGTYLTIGELVHYHGSDNQSGSLDGVVGSACFGEARDPAGRSQYPPGGRAPERGPRSQRPRLRVGREGLTSRLLAE